MSTSGLEYQQFFDYWMTRLERDLTPFIDPGTTLELMPKNRSVIASFARRGRVRTINFAISRENGVEAGFENKNMPYRAFMASPDMADLLALAKMTLQAQKDRIFVETKARRFDKANAEPALGVLQKALTEGADSDATVVVMVTGEAGTGKTSVLKQLVKMQSESYTRGQTQCLYLYVNAQGRALARFNEALATELDELRAALTFHEVAPLVRSGLLIPIIDGFDELLGVGGYDDAFSSLSAFIEELDGTGHLIASARSTYYEQEFVARANKSSSLGSHVWRQIPVEILEWGKDEFDDYVSKRCEAEQLDEPRSEQLVSDIEELFEGSNEALRSKPFFVSRAVDLELKGQRVLRSGNLLEQLVDNYVERERTEKLLDRQEAPMLTNAQIRGLLIELAEEMWNQETRELDQRSVREVADYYLQTCGLAENTRRIVTERVTAFAFLMAGELKSSIAFEHEVFFAYFLAHRICQSVESGGALSKLLGRSILPLDTARIAAQILTRPEQAHSVQQILTLLRKAAVTASVRQSQTQENAGVLSGTTLVAAAGADGVVSNVEFGDVVIPGLDLSGLRLRESRLANVTFRRVDLAGARMENCRADGVSMIEVTIDPAVTYLDVQGLDIDRDIVGLRVKSESGTETTYDPAQIRLFLQQIGVPGIDVDATDEVRHVRKHVVALMERFARMYLRSNPVCVSDDNLRGVFEDRDWSSIQDLLIRFEVVTQEYRATKGHGPKLFLRRQVLPEEILAGINRDATVPLSVRKFWEMLENEFPASD
ncbi:MAG TPA: AAA family ATPase [Burkholderiales bacterium]|nr:AAA family ATPase [Burkholderiales bacterium]